MPYRFSYHPYLFFNMDGSLTFVGFNVNGEGDLIDPVKEKALIEPKAMTMDLFEGLKRQEVDLDENYLDWDMRKMIEMLAAVMNLTMNENLLYVDPTYVLTVDNLMKILAIHMRFRYCIDMIHL